MSPELLNQRVKQVEVGAREATDRLEGAVRGAIGVLGKLGIINPSDFPVSERPKILPVEQEIAVTQEPQESVSPGRFVLANYFKTESEKALSGQNIPAYPDNTVQRVGQWIDAQLFEVIDEFIVGENDQEPILTETDESLPPEELVCSDDFDIFDDEEPEELDDYEEDPEEIEETGPEVVTTLPYVEGQPNYNALAKELADNYLDTVDLVDVTEMGEGCVGVIDWTQEAPVNDPNYAFPRNLIIVSVVELPDGKLFGYDFWRVTDYGTDNEVRQTLMPVFEKEIPDVEKVADEIALLSGASQTDIEKIRKAKEYELLETE